jgi:cell division protein FtsL
MTFALRCATAVLAVLLFASAIAVVWSKHQARSLFIQLQALNGERDALDIEWGQLKLEQSAWATHGRVEQTARVGLRMVIPRPEEVRIVTPATTSGASKP